MGRERREGTCRRAPRNADDIVLLQAKSSILGLLSAKKKYLVSFLSQRKKKTECPPSLSRIPPGTIVWAGRPSKLGLLIKPGRALAAPRTAFRACMNPDPGTLQNYVCGMRNDQAGRRRGLRCGKGGLCTPAECREPDVMAVLIPPRECQESMRLASPLAALGRRNGFYAHSREGELLARLSRMQPTATKWPPCSSFTTAMAARCTA